MTASHALLRMSRFLTSGETSEDLRSVHLEGGREADSFYRELWSHDTRFVTIPGLRLVQPPPLRRDRTVGSTLSPTPI